LKSPFSIQPTSLVTARLIVSRVNHGARSRLPRTAYSAGSVDRDELPVRSSAREVDRPASVAVDEHADGGPARRRRESIAGRR
jgi:hypothetical protein